MRVVPVPPRLTGPRELVVATCSQHGSGQLVSFEGVNDIGHAAELVGCSVLARAADLPRDFFWHDVRALLGREVQDVRLGLLGCIEEVMRGPANDVWVIRGPYGEVLVPVVDAIIREFGDARSGQVTTPIVVATPRGLVDEGGSS